MENRSVVGCRNIVNWFVMCLNNVLILLMLWEMVLSVLLVLMVGFVGQMGIGSLTTDLFFVVNVSMSRCVRIVVSVRVSVTIRFTSLMLVKTTCIVGAFTIWVARSIVITIGRMFTAIAAM